MRFASVQLLRAVAALMVVVFHSKSAFAPEVRDQLVWWPLITDFGWLGVPLFFVISGFIIGHTFSSGQWTARSFLWRRFVRIYPLYWAVMCAGLFAYAVRGSYSAEINEAGWIGIIKAFMILPQQPFPFWNPGWTLEHEVLFYVIAALLTPRLGLWWLAFSLALLGTIGFYVEFWDYHLFYLAQIYFSAGIVAYQLQSLPVRLTVPVSVICLAAGLASKNFYGALDMSMSVSVQTFLFSIGFASLLIALVGLERQGWRVPKAAVLLGDASYSIYLLHWLALPVVGNAYRLLGGHPEFWRWAFVALSIALSIASFRYFESPLNRWARGISFGQRAISLPRTEA